MKNLLIIDVSSVVWRAVYAHSYLLHNREYTGGLYGGVGQITKAIMEYNITNIVFCFDRPPYLRSLDKTYKADRKKEDGMVLKKVAISKKMFLNFCEEFSFPIISVDGFEADDGIALLAKKYNNYFANIFILSQDSDLYQLLLKDNIFLIKKDGLYGKAHFENEFDIEVDRWVDLLCLTGTHNNVKGLKGIGIKRGLKAMLDPVKYKALCSEHVELLQKNKEAIELPHQAFPTRKYNMIQFKHAQKKADKFCEKYGINYSRFEKSFNKIGL